MGGRKQNEGEGRTREGAVLKYKWVGSGVQWGVSHHFVLNFERWCRRSGEETGPIEAERCDRSRARVACTSAGGGVWEHG